MTDAEQAPVWGVVLPTTGRRGSDGLGLEIVRSILAKGAKVATFARRTPASRLVEPENILPVLDGPQPAAPAGFRIGRIIMGDHLCCVAWREDTP